MASRQDDWKIVRDCKRCMGILQIRTHNLYSVRNCAGRQHYAVRCERCNQEHHIKGKYIPPHIEDDVSDQQDALGCESLPPHVKTNRVKRCKNCRRNFSILPENMTAKVTWGVSGALKYKVVLTCTNCQYASPWGKWYALGCDVEEDQFDKHNFKHVVNRDYDSLVEQERRTRHRRLRTMAIFSIVCFPLAWWNLIH